LTSTAGSFLGDIKEESQYLPFFNHFKVNFLTHN
jgi:hypothetical protein